MLAGTSRVAILARSSDAPDRAVTFAPYPATDAEPVDLLTFYGLTYYGALDPIIDEEGE